MNSYECYCTKLKKATSTISNYYDKVMVDSGVTVSQYFILLNVSKLKEGTIRELADIAKQDRSTLARTVKPLITKGLIYDAKEIGTRNSNLLLTKKGKETLKYASTLWEEAQAHIEKVLGEKNITNLENLLDTLEKV